MTDPKKVISWLRPALDTGDCLIELPYNVVKAIYEQLKEQEPRVLTLEEVRDEYEVVWLETKYLSSTVSIVDNGESNADWLCFAFGINDSYTLSCSSYGERWRCWSSEPTQEQREAAKWDD